MRSLAPIFLSLLALFAQAAVAQDTPTRVGRVAYIEGPVSVYQDPELGWDKAYVNSPITSENSLWTDPGARAEVRIGGLALRLDEATQLDISHLDDDGIDAHVERGTLVARVRHFGPNERYRFTTPHASFRLRSDGRYRIDVDPEREESRLTVVSGTAELESSRGGVRVDSGRTLVVSGGSSPSYAFERARLDPFDRWADARDRQWSERTVTRYVSPEITGYEDLDRYGNWVEEPDYGAIWYPTRVAAGWAPYRYGHWSYVRPWGWTWIDDQPWGYAPSHYGRWVYVGDRWGWHPGNRIRQTWAPALVGWIGGSNWSVGLGSAPAVGWYPLSPWERYEPWYRASPTYVNQINIIVVDRDRGPRHWEGDGEDWRSWNRDRGATVVQRDAFIQRRPVAQAMVPITQDQVRQQPQAQGSNVLPSRNELQRFRTEQRQAAPQQQGERAQGPQGQPVQQGQQGRGDDRGNQLGRSERPNFARPQSMPVPVPSAQAPQTQPGAPRSTADVMNPGARNLPQAQPPQQTAPAQAPQGNPLGRIDGRQQREAQQQQERAAREAQQNPLQQQNPLREQQQRAAREAQQQQERAARDAQQQQQQQQQQLQRQQRDAQQQQERTAREAQLQQQQLQRQQRDAQQQQERGAREAQQQQQQQQQLQRQQQERAAREAQQVQQRAAQQQAQQVQQQAREAQNQLQRQQREVQQQQQQQQQREAQLNRAPRGGEDKAAKADDKSDKLDREGGRQR
jgi:hypothetical protein